jgi:hypothetical protein
VYLRRIAHAGLQDFSRQLAGDFRYKQITFLLDAMDTS